MVEFTRGKRDIDFVGRPSSRRNTDFKAKAVIFKEPVDIKKAEGDNPSCNQALHILPALEER